MVGHLLVVEHPRQLLEKSITSDNWARIESSIQRLYKHPVWTASEDLSDKMAAVMTSLSKNQNAEKAFSDVELKLGYVVGADNVDASCLQ